MDKRLGDRKMNPTPIRPIGGGGMSPFVGRDEEMARLAEALDLAAKGQGGTIFLTGQPGVGKTRLAREALALAKGRGFTALEGRAYPTEAGLAYAPFLDAFGPLLRSLESSHAAALASGLPSLRLLFEGFGLPPVSFSEELGEPALEKTRLFEAVSRLLERLTHENPICLFIDDVHRADPATLELLHYLARSISDRRALLLATYSNSDTSRGLRAVMRSLDREGVAEEIIVPHLKRDAVAKLARGILGAEAPGNLLDLLEARAGGVTLFVEALIAALIDRGHLIRGPEKEGWFLSAEETFVLPPSIRELILERLERLAPADRRVLDLISVLGDATSHPILLAASGLEEEPLLDAVHRLQTSELLAERTDGFDVAYCITHPLIQEVAYAELPEMGRRRAHMSAIQALERLRPDDVNRLARHYRGAGPEADPSRALATLIAAGERALSLFANEEAARHYVVALAIARSGHHAAISTGYSLKDQPLLPRLLERLGEAWDRTGERGAAVAMWDEALVEQDRTGDALATARLRRRLAIAEWDRGHFDSAEAHLGAGLATLAGQEPCQELADLHFARFYIRSRLGDIAGVAGSATELLSLAQKLTSPRTEAEACLAASSSYMWQNDLVNARERALHALLVAEQTQDLAICGHIHCVLAIIGMRSGDHYLIRYHAEQGLSVAQRFGEPFVEVYLRLYRAFANFMSGAWNESLGCVADAVGLARRIGHPRDLANSLAGRALILVFHGELSQAEACISELRLAFGSGLPMDRFVFGLVDIAESALALERGQIERALHIASSFVPFSDSALPGRAAGVALPHVPMGLMLLAEAQVAAREPENALETARRLVELGPPGSYYFTGLASRAEGLALQALGQWEAAVACHARAHEAFVAMEMPFEAARALLNQAAAAKVVQPELAADAAQRSIAAFERLGARRYVVRARQLLGVLGISPSAAGRARLGGVSVSGRELEIARLVAEGLTNSEIATRLTISPRTVGTHLEHLYARMRINSRAALARCVTDAGLL